MSTLIFVHCFRPEVFAVFLLRFITKGPDGGTVVFWRCCVQGSHHGGKEKERETETVRFSPSGWLYIRRLPSPTPGFTFPSSNEKGQLLQNNPAPPPSQGSSIEARWLAGSLAGCVIFLCLSYRLAEVFGPNQSLAPGLF